MTLTVTDNDGATDSASNPLTVTSSSGGEITLSVYAYNVKNTWYAELAWEKATSKNVGVWRDGSLVDRTKNDGYSRYSLGKGAGSATYKVCEEGTPATTCSNEVAVNW